MKMNPNEINRRIAEAVGWHQHDCGDELCWKLGTGWGGKTSSVHDLPDYNGDLNAMHEAEGTLDRVVLIKSYFYHLTSQADPEYATEHLVRASAADRAEAFLRTIGKWEDGE